MQSLKPFDIRNFTDRLEPAKGKNRYICPACNGNNLTIDPEDGAYQCWNGCNANEIREAIRPLKEALAEANGGDRVVRQQRKPASKPQGRAKSERIPSAPLPDAIALIGSIGSKEPPFTTTDLNGGWQREQVYQYGPDLRAVRYEKDDPTKPKGREKTFRQWHQSEGRWVMSKGDRPWPAYRIDEAIAGAKADRTKNAADFFAATMADTRKVRMYAVFIGHGQDFDDLSEYRPGDDITDIDWKASARHAQTMSIGVA